MFPPEEYFDILSPAVVDSHLHDADGRIQVSEHLPRGGVKAKGGGNQINQRRRVGELDAWEIAEFLKLAALLQPLDAQPIVQALERKVNILLHLQLQHGQAATSCGQ